MEENKNKEITVQLTDLWTIVRRCWIWMLIAFVVVAALSFAVLTSQHVSEYQSTSSIFVLRETDTQTSSADITVATNLINDCIEVVKSDSVLNLVIEDQNLALTTAQLRKMEANGLVHREVYAEVPPRVEYSLTELGRSLSPVIDALRAVGEGYQRYLAQDG
jgi:uncharacterized protein involved in exopolysaccharide biosynthesis